MSRLLATGIVLAGGPIDAVRGRQAGGPDRRAPASAPRDPCRRLGRGRGRGGHRVGRRAALVARRRGRARARRPGRHRRARPLVGLAAGLEAAHGSLALLVGGDQPWLSPAVLAELLLWLGEASEESSLDGVALTEGGLLRPLPAALRVATVRPIVATLLEREDLSLLGLFGHLHMGALEPARWQRLDPDGASLRDVDTPDDLRRS